MKNIPLPPFHKNQSAICYNSHRTISRTDHQTEIFTPIPNTNLIHLDPCAMQSRNSLTGKRIFVASNTAIFVPFSCETLRVYLYQA